MAMSMTEEGKLLTSGVPSADHLKLNFPMAWAASVLAWGFIEFQDVSALSPDTSTQNTLHTLCQWKSLSTVLALQASNADLYLAQSLQLSPDFLQSESPECCISPRRPWCFGVQGYSSSAQTEYAADGLRWVADYFVKCYHSDVAYTGQVQSMYHQTCH